jgi:tRNA threonylcarbamoyladenosine biosynthesis protein TsaE
MLELRAESLAETHAIAAALAGLCRPGDLIVLSGEMGAGKTAFAKGFGAALGVIEPITSPTFTLVHTYEIAADLGRGAKALHHADLYRLDRTAEVADLALEELAEYQGIVLVEWGDVVDALFGDHLVVHLESDPFAVDDLLDDLLQDGREHDDRHELDATALIDTARRIEISASGASWAPRWSRLVEACEDYRC